MTEKVQMLTPKEVAGILGVHQKTVHLWLRNGKLKGIKISYRAWRIPQSSFDHFIEQNSNSLSQPVMMEHKMEGEGVRTGDATVKPAVTDHDSPHTKMKHYIQDIMGEQTSGKNQGL
jgi:excisionase family DNA binding protein